ncbi:MAG: rhodanese-like domain-containing protein [Bacteroidales bacterium]|nr:rhodanese-like domain-containing protein [Bacteroidales bacterium]MBN2748060.1 rhodanese-like domain-containing protein [Bacteroidales bacterium]
MKSSKTLTIIVLVFTGFFLIGIIGKAVLTSGYKQSATNIAKELTSEQRFINIAQLHALITSGEQHLLIDVRDSTEYKKGRLPNAVNLPISELFSADYADIRESNISRKILYAASEADAVKALVMLMHEGYPNFIVLTGGYPIAQSSLIDTQNPSAWYSNDEKMRYNYKSLFKVGPSTEAPHVAADKVVDISNKPRGGC